MVAFEDALRSGSSQSSEMRPAPHLSSSGAMTARAPATMMLEGALSGGRSEASSARGSGSVSARGAAPATARGEVLASVPEMGSATARGFRSARPQLPEDLGDMKPAGMPSWALNEGLDGHTSGPDYCFVAPQERTANRVVTHQGENGVSTKETAYKASHDEERLMRATRRQAKLPVRRCPRPQPQHPVEDKVVEQRQDAQEDEWRRILRRQRGVPSSVTTSNAPTQASRVTAGLHSKEAAWRTEDNRCATYGRLCMALCPGDVLPPGPPLPMGGLSAASQSDVVSETQVPTGLDKLGRLLQVGSRP